MSEQVGRWSNKVKKRGAGHRGVPGWPTVDGEHWNGTGEQGGVRKLSWCWGAAGQTGKAILTNDGNGWAHTGRAVG